MVEVTQKLTNITFTKFVNAFSAYLLESEELEYLRRRLGGYYILIQAVMDVKREPIYCHPIQDKGKRGKCPSFYEGFIIQKICDSEGKHNEIDKQSYHLGQLDKCHIACRSSRTTVQAGTRSEHRLSQQKLDQNGNK